MNGLLNRIFQLMRIQLPVLLILSCLIATGCKTRGSDMRSESGGKGVYFIDSEKGKDSNPGTKRKPLKTIPELNSRLQKRPSSVCFEGGKTYKGTLILSAFKGTKSDTLIISSGGERRAIIDGGDYEAIRIEDSQNIHIIGIDIRGNGRKQGNKTNGLALKNSVNCAVEDLRTEGFLKSGIDLYDCTQIVLRKVVAVDNGFCGINVMGSDQSRSGKILIRDSRADNNPGDPTILDNHSGNGILIGMSDSVIIDHCTATSNGWDMPRVGNGPVGIWTWQSNNVVIQYCISYRNKTSKNGKDGGGFDLDGGVTNSLIQYCLSYENQGAGYGLFQYPGASDWSGNTIRYCVSINDAQTTAGAGSFFIWNGSGKADQLTDCRIYNNVVYNSSAPVISFENDSFHKEFLFINNIFLGSGDLISGLNSGSSFVGNVWWDTGKEIRFIKYKNLKEWASETGQEMKDGKIAGLQSDPGMRGPFTTNITDPYQLDKLTGYLLPPDSPVRNKGLYFKDLTGPGLPEKDFYGNPVSSGEGPEPGIHQIK